MEVRAAYCKEDFEWDTCREVALQEITSSNLSLMRESMDVSFTSGSTPQSDEDNLS